MDLLDPQPYKYWAFLSYSRKDRALADWLYRKLEGFRLPKNCTPLSAGSANDRLKPIFRDTDELRAAPNLGHEITSALEKSRALIVVCSPNAASSEWVDL